MFSWLSACTAKPGLVFHYSASKVSSHLKVFKIWNGFCEGSLYLGSPGTAAVYRLLFFGKFNTPLNSHVFCRLRWLNSGRYLLEVFVVFLPEGINCLFGTGQEITRVLITLMTQEYPPPSCKGVIAFQCQNVNKAQVMKADGNHLTAAQKAVWDAGSVCS